MWFVVKYEVEIFGKSHAEKVGAIYGQMSFHVFLSEFSIMIWKMEVFTEVCQLNIVPENKQIYKDNKKFREYYYWVY